MSARVVLLTVILLGMVPAKGQVKDSWYIGASVEMEIPVGDFHTLNGLGFGGMLRAGYLTGDNVLLTVGSGYLTFSGGLKIPSLDVSLPTPRSSVIPIVAGARYLFNEGQDTRAFAGGEAGLFILNVNIGISGLATVGTTSTEFGVSPLAGVRFRSAESTAIDALARYSIVVMDGHPSWVSVEGGGVFGMK